MNTKSTLTKNPWGYVRVDPETLKDNPYVNPVAPREPPAVDPTPDPEPTPPTPSQPINGRYIEMPRADTYGLGVQALQQACIQERNLNHPIYGSSGIYRPLTFKETIEARVNDYESHKPTPERLHLFNNWKASCCGIAYKHGSTKFKLQVQCPELITIDSTFAQGFLPVNYAKFSGVELDSSKGKYNQSITPDEILNHPVWLAVMEGNKTLLKAYCDIVFHELGQRSANKQPPGGAMGFYVLQNTVEDQLRAVFVDLLDDFSSADGSNDLYYGGRFLRVAPR